MITIAPHSPFALTLTHPYMAAAGALGYGVHTASTIQRVAPAALVTPSVTHAGRTPDGPNRMHEYRGGLWVGEPWHDPGVQWVGRRATPVWAQWDIPVIVSLAGDDAHLHQAVRDLDQVEGIAAFELSIAPQQTDLNELLARVRSACSLPLIVKLPLAHPSLLIPLVQQCNTHQVDAITLCGAAHVADGRYLSPALFPLTLYACQSIIPTTPIPVIACGGINDDASARAVREAGACAVQLGSVLLRDPDIIMRLHQG
ncbi:MAG: hypothetical protein RL076_530 [Chloroflexota bacterium]|jgi:dihydroorotate dehydrogenase (NAD+) catalytic subunit